MSDKEIIELYRKGERERAYEEIVRSYSSRLYFHVRSMVLNHEDADDLLQDIFIKVWSALPSFREEAHLYSWLYRIAVNFCINFLRKRRIALTLSLENAAVSEAAMVDSDPYFDGDRAQRELARSVAALPPKQRSVFVLRYFEELSYEEISEITGASVNSLKTSYHFAKNKITNMVKGRLPDDI